MISVLNFDDLIGLCLFNDEIYEKMSKIDKSRVDRQMKKAIGLISQDRYTKLVCDKGSIRYALKLLKYFKSPMIIAMDKYQYSSESEFWRKYVPFE